MIEKKRFIKTTSLAGVGFIKDQKDESIVAIILKSQRPKEYTEAMTQVMLDALNKAVEKQ